MEQKSDSVGQRASLHYRDFEDWISQAFFFFILSFLALINDDNITKYYLLYQTK